MGFILRQHKEDGIELNRLIGEKYSVIRKDTVKKDFDALFKTYYRHEDCMILNDDIEHYSNSFAFITFDSGSQFVLLSHTDSIYIMFENGQTFSNLTLKRK